jgi:tetratricopeptide (TPR) repeat protein
MEIWSWLDAVKRELREAEQFRLVEIIDRLPHVVCENRHEEVEAMVPEGLALARDLAQPWLEVFLRHWLAQSRILRRCDVNHGMSEIISLLEFAHREETRDCPQSVCVTQDVCCAYDVLDGPGYAQERLAASSETLERIDPSWACFHCISTERAEALIDLGRYEEAQEFCKRQLSLIAKKGSGYLHGLNSTLAEALSAQNEYEAALKVLKKPPEWFAGSPARNKWCQQKCEILGLLGRWQEALENHQKLEQLSPSGYRRWARCEELLCQQFPDRYTQEVAATLQRCFDTLKANGALFGSVEIGLIAAQMARQSGELERLQRYRTELHVLFPQLRKSDSLRTRWDALLQA